MNLQVCICFFDRHEFYSPEGAHREDWVDQMSACHNLSVIRSKDIDFRTEKLSTALAKTGQNITVLDFREVCLFRFVELFFLFCEIERFPLNAFVQLKSVQIAEH